MIQASESREWGVEARNYRRRERAKRERRRLVRSKEERLSGDERAKAIRGRGRQEEPSRSCRSAVALRQSERMTRAARITVLWLATVALLGPFAAALSKTDLYPYATPGSSILQPDVNGLLLSAETILKTPIAFYDRIYNSIFVSRIQLWFGDGFRERNVW